MSLNEDNEGIERIRNLVFSAGAMGGIAFIGGIKALEERGLNLLQVQGISGCSIGSVISLLYSIGYTFDELNQIGLSFKYKNYSDIQVLGLLEHCGFDTGRKIIKFLSKLIHNKIGINDLTFEQHWNITGRELWINTSCITTNQPLYYSVKTAPKMSVLRAIRRSISIPFMFTADKENGLQYIDGGYHDSVPSGMFKPSETLCIAVKNTGFGQMSNSVDNTFMRFCMQITINMYTSLNDYRKNNLLKKYKVVVISTGIASMAINLSRSERKRLVQVGYNNVINYLKEKHLLK